MSKTILALLCTLCAAIGFAPASNAAETGTPAAASRAGDQIRLAQRYYYDPYSQRRYRNNNRRRYQRAPVRRARPAPAPAPALWKVDEANKDPVQVIVSLPDQKISVYKGTELVTTSRVSSGRPGYSTPAGVFSILEKKRHHYSNLYGGAAMPYMQRLTWSGVALHASGSVPNRPASHGCVRLRPGFARQLFPFTYRGAHVIVANENVVPQEFTHAALFQPLGPEPEPKPEPEPVATVAPETTQSTAAAKKSEAEPGWLDWITGRATAKTSVGTKVAEAATKPDSKPEKAEVTPPASIAVSKPARVGQDLSAAAPSAIVYDAGPATPPETATLQAAPSDDAATTAATAKASTSPIRVLITRRTGRARMLEIQKLLFDLGHEPGDIDGFMGRDTAKAVKRFQEFEGMPVNGLMSDDLLAQLHKAAGMSDVKEGHIYVRQDYKDIFDAPVMIRSPEKPLGTHHFTVMHFDKDATQARWLAVSLKDRGGRRRTAARRRARAPGDEATVSAPVSASASEALDRIVITNDVRLRVARLLQPGSSLAISDHGLGPETGKGTDFIVLTH